MTFSRLSSHLIAIFKNILFLILAVLGLHCCMGFSSCSEVGLLPRCDAWASHCSGFPCCTAWALGHVDFSSCSFQSLESRLNSYGTWALAALQQVGSSQPRDLYPCFSTAGWFSTAEPPGKPQFSSVQSLSCVRLCNPMDCSTPGFPVHCQLPEFTQTHAHWVSDAIQPSHPLSSPSPPAFNLSQHQGLFQWVSSSHQVAKVLEFQLQHQSFQWTLRTGLL